MMLDSGIAKRSDLLYRIFSVAGEPGEDDLRERLKFYELIFENILHGVVITDPQGYILYLNKAYSEFLGLPPADYAGKFCLDVIENSRMHIVGKTGKAEMNSTQRIKGKEMIAHRIPIKQDGQVVAVYGQVIFRNVEDVGKLARKVCMLESKTKYYEEELMSIRSTRFTLESIAGESEAIKSLKQVVAKSASSDLPVLITGDSGTGKELFAQAIHHASNRRAYPFIRVNCAAIPKDLIESELFGYEKGAFTGADADGKPGKFEMAHRGSIFLDEIGDLPMAMQPKLLRVLEEKEFERLGGKRYINSNFRLIAASNQDMPEMLAGGLFRRDLYYRLNVIHLHIPPLRERREDIITLARHLLKLTCEEFSIPSVSFHPLAENALVDYDWPGNVRELYNVIAHVLSFLEGDTIHVDNLLLLLGKKARATVYKTDLKETVSDSEKDAIVKALATTNSNKLKAAEMLGIHRTLLYKKLKKYGLLEKRGATAGKASGKDMNAEGREVLYDRDALGANRRLDTYIIDQLSVASFDREEEESCFPV